jgi:GntR family transcriptional repressor for pyruvate dehydrogenase complex
VEPQRRDARDEDALVLRPVTMRSAASQVVDQLRAAIIDGRLRTGDRLPSEHQLAQDFGVSRGTVREAIRTLAAGKLVTSSRGATGGTFVTTPQAGELAEQIGEQIGLWFRAGNITLAEVHHARHVLERECVQLAAANRTEEDLSAIRHPIEVSRDPELGEDEWLATDVAFHTAVSKAAKNSILELAMTAVHLVRTRTNRLMLKELDRKQIADQHWAMYETIRDRAPGAAAEAFERHFCYLHEMQQRALADTNAETVPVLDIPADSGSASRLFTQPLREEPAG